MPAFLFLYGVVGSDPLGSGQYNRGHVIRSAAVLLLLSHALSVLAQCPDGPPRIWMTLALSCGTNDACPQSLLLKLRPLPEDVSELGADMGYSIQECDTVTWDFGDGTTQVVTGSAEVTHDYPAAGNYTITVTVANALGSVTKVMAKSLAIADSPSELSFVVSSHSAPNGCSNCVIARENDGVVTIGARRTLDLSRTISAVANVRLFPTGGMPGVHTVSQTITFAPNETEKTFTVPLENDSRYYGTRFHSLSFTNPTGGAFPRLAWPSLQILEDDPLPGLSIDASITVIEGQSGLTRFTIPVHLSEPMARFEVGNVNSFSGSASADDYRGGGQYTIEAGQTAGVYTGYVNGDLLPELDETFTIRLSASAMSVGNQTATVTIINDDSHGPPHAVPTVGTYGAIALTIALAALAFRRM
jgi:PKD repeat protein